MKKRDEERKKREEGRQKRDKKRQLRIGGSNDLNILNNNNLPNIELKKIIILEVSQQWINLIII